MKFKLSENEVYLLIKEGLKYSEVIKDLPLVEDMLLRQAQKESSLFMLSTRYESHIDDCSVGLYQLLTSTLRWLGFNGDYNELFNPETQVTYAIHYLDYLYSKFPEIRSRKERVKVMFSAYNCGLGNINKGIKYGLMEEEIHYEGANTLQGKWSTYEKILEMMVKHKRLSEKNADINKRYVDYITKGLI